MTEKLETGDVNGRKAYIRVVISAIEVDDKSIRIIGCKDTLLAAIAGKQTANKNVRGFVRKWRTITAANVSLEAADALIAAALGSARSAGFEVSVAVVDAGGEIRSFGRSDGAPPMTADVAIDKAWTSATSGYPTHVWNQIVADPTVALLTKLPRMMAISGGFRSLTWARSSARSAYPAGATSKIWPLPQRR